MNRSGPFMPDWGLRISLDLRHGFEVMGTIQVGRSPVVTPMIRHPR
jgi:hypothetical protein